MQKNKALKILETRRCIVRELTITDVPAEIELYEKSPHMTDYIPPLLDRERQLEYIRLYIEKIYGKYGYGMWAVIDKKSGRLIGEAGLEHRNDTNREKFPYDWMFAPTCSELGFCIAEDLWNKGYCTEVTGGILAYGKDVLRHKTFFARATPTNPASLRVLAKLGFSHYGGEYYRLIT